jgi:hypothetical protein
MLIKLSEIPVVCLTIEKNKDRQGRIAGICDKLGITNLEFDFGEITHPYTVGIAKQHLKVLAKNKHRSVLIIEDDCNILNFKTEFEIESYMDAVYLGHSHYGMIRGKSQYRGCISSFHKFSHIRPYNMLGMHSIFYPFTSTYGEEVSNDLIEFIRNPVGGCDELVAMRMKDREVYCLEKSIFYQNDGHSNEETSRPLEPHF